MMDRGGDDNAEDENENDQPQRPVPTRLRITWKAADNSQKRREGHSEGPKSRKPGKKTLQAAAEMSQLLDGYVPPPSNAALLDS